MKNKTILIIGDVMLDEYIFGRITRKSPEAPKTPVILVRGKKYVLGGAANVAANIVSLGAKAILVGCVGKDDYGKDLRDLLRRAGIMDRTFASTTRPTTVKTRLFEDGRQLARVDTESAAPLSPPERRRFTETLNRLPGGIDFVIVSDYAKGMLSAGTMRLILKKFSGEKILGDAKPVHKNLMKGLCAITPNLKELSQMAGTKLRRHDHVRKTAAKLARELRTSIIATLGREGMIVCDKNGLGFHRVPAPKVRAVDVTGAGDVAAAACAIALAGGTSLFHAAEYAVRAASLSVAKPGTATVRKNEIRNPRRR